MSNGELCFKDKCFPIQTVTFLCFNMFSVGSAFLQKKKNDSGIDERIPVVSGILDPNASNAQQCMTLSKSLKLSGP